MNTITSLAAQYVAADRAGKAALRAEVTKSREAAIIAADWATVAELTEALGAMKSTKPEAAPVDYVQLVANHRATLVAALEALDSGKVTLPEGVEVPEYTPAMIADGVAGDVAQFVKVAGRKAGRGSVAQYVEVVLQDFTPGDVLTIADLRKAWTEGSHAGYPTQPPSAGAIAAFLDRGEHGYEETTNEKGTRAIIA